MYNVQMITVFGKLVASSKDIDGYVTYVFEMLDQISINEIQSPYLMTVQYYNWIADPINIGDKGYVKIKEVKAGVDQWWDGTKHNYYKYDDVVFYKFVPYQEKQDQEIILV